MPLSGDILLEQIDFLRRLLACEHVCWLHALRALNWVTPVCLAALQITASGATSRPNARRRFRLAGPIRVGSPADRAFAIFDCARECFYICGKRPVFPECLCQEAEQRLILRLSDQAVIHPVPVSPIRHDSGILEIGQVAGDIGLRALENVLNIATAQFPRRQQVQGRSMGSKGNRSSSTQCTSSFLTEFTRELTR